MAENKIHKDNLDRCIDLTRTYYAVGTLANEDALQEMLEAAKELENDVGLGVFALLDFISSIIRYSGMKPEATNEDIYKVLEVLGWQVAADEQAEH